MKGEVETGYEISSSRYKIIVYDKINENERAKNILKRKYYADLYDQFIDSGVTRIEVRLKQELCKELSKLFFDLTLSEDEFIRFALSRIYSKHKLRYRPINSSDQDFRRWPVHPRWEYIFKGESKSLPIIKTSPNFLYTTPSSNIEKILGQLVEAIAHSDPSRTKEQLKEAVSRVDFESVSTKVNRRVMERELSKKHLEKIKKDMLENCKDLIDFNTGQLGIPITSPTKRNQDEYLNT